MRSTGPRPCRDGMCRFVPNWVPTVGSWLGFPAVWVEPVPLAEGSVARRVSDRGVLAHLVALARPTATVQDLADFIERHGWLPLELRGRRTRAPRSKVTVLVQPQEATKEDRPTQGSSRKH